jgi:hypothetical protein
VLTNGPITDDLVTMHTCDVRYPVGDISYRRCCNPAHTTRGSRADNNAWRDTMGRAAKGEATRPETRARGEAAALSKLTEVQVHEIRLILATTRLRYGHGYAAIGRQFDVGQQAIRDIHSGRTWRHVR